MLCIMQSVAFIYCYAQCRYAECRGTVLNPGPINILARLRMLDTDTPLSSEPLMTSLMFSIKHVPYPQTLATFVNIFHLLIYLEHQKQRKKFF